MKEKLSNNELKALCDMLNAVMKALHIKKDNGELDFDDLLHLALIEKMWLLVYKKQLERKEKYTIKLEAEQALCFYIQFNGINISDPYLANIVRRICSKVHQQIC